MSGFSARAPRGLTEMHIEVHQTVAGIIERGWTPAAAA
jgi:hypothetical protein